MRVLSIDVGVRNLGVCELEASREAGEELGIGFWNVVSGAGQTDNAIQTAISGAVDAMLELCENNGGAGWDCVVIENQPCIKNPRMKAVQTAIHTFLVMQFGPDVNVCLASAVGKNKIADSILAAADGQTPRPEGETPGQKYRRTKKRSIDATRRYLGRDPRHGPHLAAMEASPKKDDMCDSFLQGLYFLTTKAKILTI